MRKPVETSAARSVAPVHIVGLGATPFAFEQDAMLDELAFQATYGALRECGLRKQDLGLSVLASMDVLDGRSISSGLVTAATGGYLTDSFRIEGDAGQAVIAAAEAVAAGDVEVAVAVGIHNPETSGDDDERRAFVEQISNLGFDPLFNRPVGLTATMTYAMHASRTVVRDGGSIGTFAELAASEISRAAGRPRSVRSAATVEQVLTSSPTAWPLTELMLPAASTGAVAVVVASPARAGRCTGRDTRVIGFGHSTGGYTWQNTWWSDPATTTRRAAMGAFRQASIRSSDVDLAEISAATPALHPEYVAALGIEHASVNRSGGVRSNYPGLANGALRLFELVESLEVEDPGSIGLSHSTDLETGLVSEDVTVLVVESI